MDSIASFGYWVQRQRKALDLTRAELARQVGCATVTIKKIETDERRPSEQIAALLAEALRVPGSERSLFVQGARGERAVDRLVIADKEPRAPAAPGAAAIEGRARDRHGMLGRVLGRVSLGTWGERFVPG